MTKRKVFGYLLGTIIFIYMLLPMVAAISFADQKANASSSNYTINSWQKKKPMQSYFNADDGCTYVIRITENSDAPIEKIYYSAYQISINTEDISYDDEGNITNPFAKDKEENEIDRVEVLESQIEGRDGNFDAQNNRQISFEVTAYEWSAYQFFVQWDNMGEKLEEEGNFLYCTNIDNSAPYIALIEDTPIMQDNGFLFEFVVRANQYNADRSANSGLKKVIIYKDEEPVKEYTKFTNSLTFYGDFLATKGEWFIEAIDGVGNETIVRVIKIDYNINDVALIGEAESILADSQNYKKQLIDNLKKVYIEWQLLSLDEDATDSQLEDTRMATMDAVFICIEAQKDFKVKVINNFYFDNITVENLNEENYADIVKGETITMNISLAEISGGYNNYIDLLQESHIKKADRVIALDISLTSDIKELTLSDFVNPIKIQVPLAKYKDVAAVSEKIINGQKTYSLLRIDKGDDWIVVYVPTAQTTVNLIIDEGIKGDLRYLYLLFLILPVAGGILLFVYREKIFKNKKATKQAENQDEMKEKFDEQNKNTLTKATCKSQPIRKSNQKSNKTKRQNQSKSPKKK